MRFYSIGKGNLVILSISFASSSVKIASQFDHEGLWPDPYKIIDYADPKFTDDFLFDEIKVIAARFEAAVRLDQF